MAGFNPLGREEYEETVASWVGSLLVLAHHLTLHPHASAVSQEASQLAQPQPKSPPTKQDLARRAPDKQLSISSTRPQKRVGLQSNFW